MALFFPCQAENNQSDLIRQILMKSYDPLVRPVNDSSQKLSLHMSMGLKGFVELDMKKQTLVSFGWLTVTWYDQFLRWDPKQYPFHTVYLTADMVWRPDLIIFNTVSDLDQLESQKRKVLVESSGKVTWYPGGLFQTFCSVNIFYYPLDTQTCGVEVSTWLYTNDLLSANLIDPAFEASEDIERHPEWALVKKKAVHSLRYGNWQMQFSFTLKRKVTFYVFNMILPICLLSLTNYLVFLLPVESGEKMTVSVTIFLSFAVFLSLINNSLPPNSDSVCLFSVYVAIQMSLSVCFIVMAACIVFIYEQDTDVSTPCGTLKSPGSTMPGGKLNTENGQASHCDTLPVDAESTEDSEGAVFPRDRRGGSVCTNTVWLMVTNVRHLRPQERHVLSQQLDRMCLKLSVVTNVMACLVFACIWVWG
ncbi:hypothetical protein ACOMHN_027151 [Nucella lapillus]